MKAVIYNPPTPSEPYLAVLFGDDGAILTVAAVRSPKEGETLLSEMACKIANFSHRL